MREALKNLFGKEIILEDGTAYTYTVQPYEMKNALGAAVAVLDEYSFSKKGSLETYKLYRTSEGNWYDVGEENSSILRSLKLAFTDKNPIN